MINKIESLLKGYAQEAVADIKEIPTGQTDAVADAASGSIIDILKKKFLLETSVPSLILLKMIVQFKPQLMKSLETLLKNYLD